MSLSDAFCATHNSTNHDTRSFEEALSNLGLPYDFARSMPHSSDRKAWSVALRGLWTRYLLIFGDLKRRN